MFFNLLEAPLERRGLLNEIVAPRPIAWVSTISKAGTRNLAPFSHFNLVSTAPAMLMFACNTPADRPAKDTLANIGDTKEFVVNIVGSAFARIMVESSAPFPYGTDEFASLEIEALPSALVAPERVRGVPAALECRLHQIVEIEPERDGETASHVVFGKIVALHVDDAVVDDKNRYQSERAGNVARIGGPFYVETRNAFAIPPKFTARE